MNDSPRLYGLGESYVYLECRATMRLKVGKYGGGLLYKTKIPKSKEFKMVRKTELFRGINIYCASINIKLCSLGVCKVSNSRI